MVKAEVEAEEANFKKLEAEAEAEGLDAEAEVEAVTNLNTSSSLLCTLVQWTFALSLRDPAGREFRRQGFSLVISAYGKNYSGFMKYL